MCDEIRSSSYLKNLRIFQVKSWILSRDFMIHNISIMLVANVSCSTNMHKLIEKKRADAGSVVTTGTLGVVWIMTTSLGF